jgi:hypothetical protein
MSGECSSFKKGTAALQHASGLLSVTCCLLGNKRQKRQCLSTISIANRNWQLGELGTWDMALPIPSTSASHPAMFLITFNRQTQPQHCYCYSRPEASWSLVLGPGSAWSSRGTWEWERTPDTRVVAGCRPARCALGPGLGSLPAARWPRSLWPVIWICGWSIG